MGFIGVWNMSVGKEQPQEETRESQNNGKTDEELYKEAFDHFDTNHSDTVPTDVSSSMDSRYEI